MSVPPIPCRWDGKSLTPLERWYEQAADLWMAGEVYRVVCDGDRTMKSHNHMFAVVGEAHKHLSDEALLRFPTPEHLRKYALIRAGYRDERSIACASKAEAAHVAAWARPLDPYSAVIVREAVVTVLTAKSQSQKAMGRRAFQESKTAVLDTLADMIGVEPTALKRRAIEGGA